MAYNRNNISVPAMGPGVNLADTTNMDHLPGMQLTEEQKEICKKDRELLAKRLLYIVAVQVLLFVANMAVGVAGSIDNDTEAFTTIPINLGSFLCAAGIAFSFLGAYCLRRMAIDFKPEKRSEACCCLLTLEIPNILLPIGAMMSLMAFVTTDALGSTDDGEIRGAAIAAIVLIPFNLILTFVVFGLMCTSRKAFVTNQAGFNRPLIQTRHQQTAMMMAQQQLILQQQMVIQQQQLQNQQAGLQLPPTTYNQLGPTGFSHPDSTGFSQTGSTGFSQPGSTAFNQPAYAEPPPYNQLFPYSSESTK